MSSIGRIRRLCGPPVCSAYRLLSWPGVIAPLSCCRNDRRRRCHDRWLGSETEYHRYPPVADALCLSGVGLCGLPRSDHRPYELPPRRGGCALGIRIRNADERERRETRRLRNGDRKWHEIMILKTLSFRMNTLRNRVHP